MAHKTKVNSTDYKIVGGKTLVNGTNYKIVGGKTLVGGTVYRIGFGVPVNVTGSGNDGILLSKVAAWIEINDTKYSSATTLQIQPNTIIKCCCIEEYGIGFATIILNGSVVAKSSEYTTLSYDYIVKENVEKITIELDRSGSSSGGYYGIITITEE